MLSLDSDCFYRPIVGHHVGVRQVNVSHGGGVPGDGAPIAIVDSCDTMYRTVRLPLVSCDNADEGHH